MAQRSKAAPQTDMKPTFQVSRSGRVSEPRATRFNSSKAPATDWSFQSSGPVLRGGSASLRGRLEGSDRMPRLWALSQGFIEAEAKREYRLEAVLFGVIVALAAWPIALALQAAAQLVR